jgi:hypothetical protein
VVSRRRAALIVGVGLVGAAVTILAGIFQGELSDFYQAWQGAKFLLAGTDPYSQIGPGLAVDQLYGLYYPLTALWVALPFAGLIFIAARAVFFGLGAAGMMWAFTKSERDPRMLLTVSGAFLFSAVVAQWEPVLVMAALTPALGFLLVAKPSVGLALFAAYPNKKAALGCAVFLLATIVVWPGWLKRWITIAAQAPTVRPLAWHPIGILALAAFARWRDGDARLVAVSALVPLTPLPYSAVLLFPAAKHMREVVALIIGSWLAIAGHRFGWPYASDVARLDWMRGVMALTCWAPMAALMLLRPVFARRAAAAAGEVAGGSPLRAPTAAPEGE